MTVTDVGADLFTCGTSPALELASISAKPFGDGIEAPTYRSTVSSAVGFDDAEEMWSTGLELTKATEVNKIEILGFIVRYRN
jgi:hypothetical protein